MTDDRRLTTDRFYGGTSQRLQLLRRFLSFVESEDLTRSDAKDWILSNTDARSRDAIDHHFGFLDAIELIDLHEDEVSVDWRGRQYLESRESSILYSALNANVKGFDSILVQLREGPMTDEEIMLHLRDEFDKIDMDSPGVATRHREWLQVLGYVDRNGNSISLTAKGGELAAEVTTEDLTEGASSISELATELPDGSQTTRRRETIREEVIRDESLVREIKSMYDDRCQICGEKRRQEEKNGYSEVHHLMPLGNDGPDISENVVVVCPNHHVDFENGMLTVDPQTLVIHHQYESDIDGRDLLCKEEHDVGEGYLTYHNEVVAQSGGE